MYRPYSSPLLKPPQEENIQGLVAECVNLSHFLIILCQSLRQSYVNCVLIIQPQMT